MEANASKLTGLAFIFFVTSIFVVGQQSSNTVFNIPDVPSKFTLDKEEAERLKPQLMAESIPASGSYEIGRAVMEKLAEHIRLPASAEVDWQLRIVEDGLLNAYSSPDGTLYVESGLAQLAGSQGGLWAAILSHEIAHVERRDWARRYLYQKSLQKQGDVLLGDRGNGFGSWMDSKTASQDMGRVCRQLEVEADREGLRLMARAGYHPDFVPALHHLLKAQLGHQDRNSALAMHPCWEQRDQELSRDYTAASIEFERLWPEWYISPGGNPPVVVFTEEPTIRKTGEREWTVQVPLRCQNLAGSVEVLMRETPVRQRDVAVPGTEQKLRDRHEMSQLTGCTSPRTVVSFVLADRERRSEIYVLDSRGFVLARADVPQK